MKVDLTYLWDNPTTLLVKTPNRVIIHLKEKKFFRDFQFRSQAKEVFDEVSKMAEVTEINCQSWGFVEV